MKNKKVVLLIEDDPDDVQLTLMAMADLLKPYEVVVARDGVEALDYLLGTGGHARRDAAERPSLIILDLNLPRVGGVQILERLNQEWGPGLGNVKIAVLSSSYMPQERVVTTKLGAALHMQKPLRPEESAAMVREIGGLLSLPVDKGPAAS